MNFLFSKRQTAILEKLDEINQALSQSIDIQEKRRGLHFISSDTLNSLCKTWYDNIKLYKVKK